MSSWPDPVLWLLPLLCSLALTLFVEKLCRRWGLYDHPGERKMQTVPIPRMGGFAFIFTASLFVWIFKIPIGLDFVFGAGLVFLGGLIDDMRSANAVLNKVAFQIPGALAFAVLTDLNYLHASSAAELAARGLIFIFIFFLINAANLMDNMNGLTAGLSMILFLGLSWTAALATHLTGLAGLGLLLAISVSGFYVRNYPFGRIYMGDQGSQFLGFALAAYAVMVIPRALGSEIFAVFLGSTISIAVLFFLFIFDVVSVVFIRLREGRSPFQGDQSHISHRLVRRGITPAYAVLILTGVQTVLTLLFVFKVGRLATFF